MTRKSVAQLTEELAAEKAENQRLVQRNETLQQRTRARFSSGLWPRKNRKSHAEPEFTGSVRFIVPPEKQAGDYIWLDIATWNYDEATCPLTFEDNPPDLTTTISPMEPEWEELRETQRIEAMQQKQSQQ